MRKILVASFLFLLFMACDTPTEGCLDPFASNYSILADKECEEECCTYPSLKLSISYNFGEEAIDTSLYYFNNINSYFKLKSFFVSFSNFELVGDLQTYSVINEFPDLPVLDDLAYFEYRTSEVSPGDLRLSDRLTSFTFEMGIPDELNRPVNPNLDYEVIETLTDSMLYETDLSAFYYLGVNVEVDSVSGEELSFRFSTLAPASKIEVQLDENIAKGTSLIFPLTISFDQLFSDVDLQTDNAEIDAIPLILENIPASIEVK